MRESEMKIYMSEALAGRYRALDLIGAGHFSGTFRALDLMYQREVALKILKLNHCSTEEAVVEFRGEIALLRKLTSSDRVINIEGAGRHDIHLAHMPSGGSIPVQTEFAVLELAVCSLAQLLLHSSRLDWSDRLRLYRDIVKGVHQMHLAGVVHRDIKAENALVFEQPQVAKIADLGRSHDTHEPARFAVEAYIHGRGDIRFAPLEFLWLQGTIDPDDQARADVYLLGSLLFEVATGMGITSMIATNPIELLRQNRARDEEELRRDWQMTIPWLQESARPVLGTLEAAAPPLIRERLVTLTAMLTNADPQRRLPTYHGGRRYVDPWDLQWLLEKIDGMRRAIDPALRQSYLARRRHRSPSRHPRASRKP